MTQAGWRLLPGVGPPGPPVTARPNALANAVTDGRFCYVVELVASALRREWQVLETASRLARIPHVAAASITSYAGGAMGHDPIRVGVAARARGLTPNIHLTCASRDRIALRKALEDLAALELANVFALTGDWPRDGEPVFDLDAVQLVRMIAELRRERGIPFFVSVAVSPFKYTEADCVYQYVKLEKKIAAGADLAITQVGWDARKFVELKRYLDGRGLRTPVLGNVYVLGRRAAERMAGGEPPGCWVSPELLEMVRAESEAKDGGLRARLERAARTVALLRGLGYAGAYLGGTHDPAQIQWIIRRAERLTPRWEDLAGDLGFGAPDGFYLDDQPAQGPMAASLPDPAAEGPRGADLPRTRGRMPGGESGAERGQPALDAEGDRRGTRRGASGADRAGRPPPGRSQLVPRALDALGHVFPVSRDTPVRRALTGVCAWVDRRPRLATAVERVERAVKQPLFGCQACGNCVLSHMEYVCPQTCPKQMRNGPCGGTSLGGCEVVDRPCIWVSVYHRARDAGRVDALHEYIPPPDRALAGTSSWINYFLERDRRPGRGDAS